MKIELQFVSQPIRFEHVRGSREGLEEILRDQIACIRAHAGNSDSVSGLVEELENILGLHPEAGDPRSKCHRG